MPRAVNQAESVARVGALVRDRVTGDASADLHREGKARLEAALMVGGFGRRGQAVRAARPARAMWLVAAAFVAIALVVVLVRPRPRLEYAAEGARVEEGGYIAARPGEQARVRFTDGSEIALSEASRVRVADVTNRGARVVLESGQANVHITHLPRADWSVQAGPFVIVVTGTRFDVAWSAVEEQLEIHLRDGAVVVKGSLASEGVSLRAGQRFVARPSTGELRIDDDSAVSPGHAGVDDSPSIAPSTRAEAAPSAAAVPSASATAVRSSSWPTDVAHGDFKRVLAEADERGLEGCIAQCSLSDLVALADAARWGHRPDLARSALMAQRSRFADSTEARSAAFLLGRLADEGSSGSTAVEWYDRYLAEAPNGPFAAEALGRKMVAVRKTAGDAAARPIAEQYLQRFPGGAHAPIARALAAAP